MFFNDYNRFMSESIRRISSLDLCRATAAIWVALFHLPSAGEVPILSYVIGRGQYGVDLFFVLSGYLIGDQWLKSLQKQTHEVGENLKQFYIRRCFRIWPNYFLVLFIVYFFTDSFSLDPGASLWRFFLFIQNFYPIDAYGVSWSLCVEEHFYLLFPILSVLVFRMKNARFTTFVFVAIFMVSFLLRVVLWFRYRPDQLVMESNSKAVELMYLKFYYPSWVRMDGLTAGVLLATIKNFRPMMWTQWMKRTHWFFAAFWVLFLGNVALGSNLFLRFFSFLVMTPNSPASYGIMNTWMSPFVVSIAFACLIASALSDESILQKIRGKWLTLLAGLSFSLYLVHPMVFHWVEKYWVANSWGHHPYLMIFIEMSAALFLSWLIFTFVETPFLKLRDRQLKH